MISEQFVSDAEQAAAEQAAAVNACVELAAAVSFSSDLGVPSEVSDENASITAFVESLQQWQAIDAMDYQGSWYKVHVTIVCRVLIFCQCLGVFT